jgi:ribosomal protein S6--L-glutamate ligase
MNSAPRRLKLVSFDPMRTIGFADITQLKPLQMYQHAGQLREADCVLFPEYWQLNALLYAWKAKIFPSEASYRIGHNKIEMTRAFMAVAPHNTPDTYILANTPGNAEEIWHSMPQPFVAKLPKSSQGEGVWLIQTHSDWQQYLGKTDVLYVQEYLPIDRDLRIVLVGDRILTAYWRLQSPYSFHNNLSRGGEAEFSEVPQAALDLVLQVSHDLGIDHAGFDVAMVGERPYLFELNRLFGNKGIEGGDARVSAAILEWLARR